MPADTPPRPVAPAWQREGTVYVMGIDGMTLDVIAPMQAQGDLPNLARLAEGGAAGPLRTLSPTNSSLLWTTIATGRSYRDHGIDGFDYYRLFGRRVSRSSVRRAKKLLLRPLFKLALRTGLMKPGLLDGRDVRVPTLWDLVSEAGGSAGVVNWWNTWPAEPLNGFCVSDRLTYWRLVARRKARPTEEALTYPTDMLDDIRSLVVPPEAVTADEVLRFVSLDEDEVDAFLDESFTHHDLRGELRFLIAGDRTSWAAFEHGLDAEPDLDLACVYLRAPDIAHHCAHQYMGSARDVPVSDADRRRFSQVVPEAYRLADELVGRLMERLRPQDTLLVLSDHGFAYQPKRGDYGHARGEPPGVLYAFGADVRRGVPLPDAGLYDVAPTVLRLLGFPLARNLEGRCLHEILTDAFLEGHPAPDPVQDYGPRRHHHTGTAGDAAVDDEVVDHLRALGYLE